MSRSIYSPKSNPPRNRKKQGEYAEAQFLARALQLGFIVSRPWGDSAPYDFIVQPKYQLYRIQVKSAWSRYGGQYPIKTSRSGNVAYDPRDFEFIAAYVIPYDAWYIIPMSFIAGRKCIFVYAHNKQSRGKQEIFREAWQLLK